MLCLPHSRALVMYLLMSTGPFPFLPIRAADLYDKQYSQPGHKLSDLVISSYGPTLSILAQPPNPSVALCLPDVTWSSDSS
ncbi:hypothetical protein L210DRAFT_3589029 [Boletus edulis BED1]|uniref:Uncharacterized protein n=1 Tax=Boletus edulis BED1 TaxID=1328754 RepID=A0AAD4G5C9_BOLED|nr:hypothetical protein L210DRAFT_3589029 [Boletus edulis BED1]